MKDFITKNKKIIIGIMVFIALNIIIVVAWQIMKKKEDDSPNATDNQKNEQNHEKGQKEITDEKPKEPVEEEKKDN